MAFLRAVFATIALATVSAGATTLPALVDGTGVVTESSNLCRHPSGPAALHLTLAPEPGETSSIDHWRVLLEGSSVFGCPVADATACAGAGTLGEGVAIGSCLPLGGSGKLDPLVVCIPGPMAPRPVVRATGTIHFDAMLGSFDGELALLLVGDAVTEVPSPCV